MSRKEKLIQKIKNNPKVIRFEEADKILLDIGFERRQPKGGSSHYTYTLSSLVITIPYKKPYVKEIYIRKIIEMLDKIESN